MDHWIAAPVTQLVISCICLAVYPSVGLGALVFKTPYSMCADWHCHQHLFTPSPMVYANLLLIFRGPRCTYAIPHPTMTSGGLCLA